MFRKNSVFPKFLQFKVSNQQLRVSKAYISAQKRLLNQEINNKQKAVKSIQQKVREVKNSLNCKMSYIDYFHVCNTFLVSNNKNISKVKETQDKKLCNLVLRNMGNNSDTWQDPDKVIFNFSTYNLSDHENIVLCKGLSFAIPPKTIEYSEFLGPSEMLFRDINSLEVGNLDKECVKSRLRDFKQVSFKQVSKISGKNLSKGEVKALNNLVKNKDIVIQKADKSNNIVILNRSDYISKLSKILEDTSKFKRVNMEEGKAMNHLIHMEERIIRLLKSLEDQGEISEKEKNDLYPSGSKPGVRYRLAKIHKALEDGTRSFCPILSGIGTPTYNLAKFCDKLLKPLTSIDYTIKDPFSYATEVLDFDASCFMASFDIKSLFTNIPPTETVAYKILIKIKHMLTT